MKFALTTSFDSPYKGVADLTLPVLMEYCDRHGYELTVRQNPRQKHGIIWGRIEDMEAYDGDADWCVHVDADMLITNHTISLDEIVNKVEKNHFAFYIIGTDQNGINDGMLFIRNVKDAFEPMTELRAMGCECFQAALEKSLKDKHWPFGCFEAPQRLFNSYFKDEYPDQDPEGVWQEGDFCLHLPGRSNPRRVEILNQIIPLIQR